MSTAYAASEEIINYPLASIRVELKIRILSWSSGSPIPIIIIMLYSVGSAYLLGKASVPHTSVAYSLLPTSIHISSLLNLGVSVERSG